MYRPEQVDHLLGPFFVTLISAVPGAYSLALRVTPTGLTRVAEDIFAAMTVHRAAFAVRARRSAPGL
jgi:hypothetical protein